MDLVTSLTAIAPDAVYDLVVVGAGGAGMAAALFAALDGRSVLLVESTALVGGTTAWSAGTTWVPGTHLAAKVNASDCLADAERYLHHAIGTHSSAAMRRAFLENGPSAILELERHTDVHFRPYPKHPDYLSELDGSTLAGRALEPLPFDGRRLGTWFELIRPPIPEFTVLGGMMVDRTDINHLLAMTRSFRSFRHAAKILLRHAGDRLRHPRGTRLVMGNALVARLLQSLTKQPRVTLAVGTAAQQLDRGDHGIDAVRLVQGAHVRTVRVRGGVVLASGGFNRHPHMRADMLPGHDSAWCPGAPGHTGAAHDLARQQGARYGAGAATHAFWAPVSLRRRTDGSTAVFPHFVMDRAKPGMLAVNQAGARFVNESTSYHLFALAMQHAHQNSPRVPAYLVCDAEALRKYGIGMVRPGGKGLAPFLADGYLTQGDSLQALAGKLGIDGDGLQRSVTAMNQYAETGLDTEFQRGVTAYQQNLGDPAWPGPNPNLGPLRQPPFYAVRLYPGDIGSATGLVTDADACVLDAQDQPIPGLYAVGNDMHSIMGGVYTAPGITIGPGLVFARQAARHACTRAGATP